MLRLLVATLAVSATLGRITPRRIALESEEDSRFLSARGTDAVEVEVLPLALVPLGILAVCTGISIYALLKRTASVENMEIRQSFAAREMEVVREDATATLAGLNGLLYSAMGDLEQRQRELLYDAASKFLSSATPDALANLVLAKEGGLGLSDRSAPQPEIPASHANLKLHTASELDDLYAAATVFNQVSGTQKTAAQRALMSMLLDMLRAEFDAMVGGGGDKSGALLLKSAMPELSNNIDAAGGVQDVALFAKQQEPGEGDGLEIIRIFATTLDPHAVGLDGSESVLQSAKDAPLEQSKELNAGLKHEAIISTVMPLFSASVKQEMTRYLKHHLPMAKKIKKYAHNHKHFPWIGIAASSIGPLIGVGISLRHLYLAKQDEKLGTFTVPRDIGLTHEHAAAEVQRVELETCIALGGLLQHVASAKIESELSPEALKALFGKGPLATALDASARESLGGMLQTRLCGIYDAIKLRTAALFRKAGRCQAALDRLRARARVNSGSSYNDAAAFPLADGDDIVDVVLTNAREAWTGAKEDTFGVAYQAIGGAPELNGILTKACANGGEPCKPVDAASSRSLVFLRRKDLGKIKPAAYVARGGSATATGGSTVGAPIQALKDMHKFSTDNPALEVALEGGLAISDIALLRLERDPYNDMLLTEPLKSAIDAGWIPLPVRGAPGGDPPKSGANAAAMPGMDHLGVDGINYDAPAVAKWTKKDGKTTLPPVILVLVKRGGSSALTAIESLPFHAMVKKERLSESSIAIDATDMLAAVKNRLQPVVKKGDSKSANTRLTMSCPNIRAPAGCTAFDTIEPLTRPKRLTPTSLETYLEEPVSAGKVGLLFKHALRTECAPSGDARDAPYAFWERLLPSPMDASKIDTKFEQARPYLWLRRRVLLPKLFHVKASGESDLAEVVRLAVPSSSSSCIRGGKSLPQPPQQLRVEDHDITTRIVNVVQGLTKIPFPEHPAANALPAPNVPAASILVDTKLSINNEQEVTHKLARLGADGDWSKAPFDKSSGSWSDVKNFYASCGGGVPKIIYSSNVAGLGYINRAMIVTGAPTKCADCPRFGALLREALGCFCVNVALKKVGPIEKGDSTGTLKLVQRDHETDGAYDAAGKFLALLSATCAGAPSAPLWITKP